MINKFGSGAVDALFEGLGDQMRVSQRNYFLLDENPDFFVIDFMNRFGCLMPINYQSHLQISMSLDIPNLHLTPRLLTTQNLFTAYNFIQKLHTPPMGKQSSENLFLIYADVVRIGRW